MDSTNTSGDQTPDNPETTQGVPAINAGYRTYQTQRNPGVEGVLTRLFGNVCLNITRMRGLTLIQWQKLMADYLRDLDENHTSIDRMNVRGNLNKEFRRPKQTWAVFCKGMKFLKFLCFHVGIEAVCEDGNEISAGVGVALVSLDKLKATIGEDALAAFLAEREAAFKSPYVSLVSAADSDRAKTEGAHAIARTGVPYGNQQKKPRMNNDLRGVLSILFDKLCLAYSQGKGIDHAEWNRLMIRYVDEFHGELDHARKISKRGGLNKSFRRGSMSWKEYCKAMRFLTIKSFTITITGIRADGNEYESTSSLSFAKTPPAGRFGQFRNGLGNKP